VAKTKIKFPIKDIHSNGANLTVLNYYYNNLTEHKLVDESANVLSEEKLEIDGYVNDVVTSNFEEFTKEILKSINTQNDVRLEALLKLNFVYECDDATSDDGGDIMKLKKYFKKATVSPVLEAFFHDQIDSLIEIILALINKNNDLLFRKFIKAISKTELDNKNLYVWNDTIKTATLKLLDNLRNHAEKLGDKKANDLSVEKGSKLYALTDSLAQDVQAHEVAQTNTLKGYFETLLYKLTLKRRMHQEDELLSQHHGAFQRGIISLKAVGTRDSHNFVSLAKHNDSFFAPKTTSQKLLDKVEAAVFNGSKRHR
jgi:hypothetical protein